MKTITIGSRTLQYEVFCDTSEYGDSYETKFYEGEETYTYRKYWLWGPKITKTRAKYVFTIYENADNKRLTKDWWRVKISHELELLDRAKQLEKGELI